jgi:phosphohistidine phosphatase SixA
MKFKHIYYLFSALLLFSASGIAQSSSNTERTLYIVRHAEKDTGNNPGLTAKGRKRAGDLYRLLKDKKIDLIFTSHYKRTATTADSLRIYNKLDTVFYAADLTGDKLFEKIEERAGNATNILIVGHSNTLPAIIRRAGVHSYSLNELPETEYDNLFIVKQKAGTGISLQQEKYGEPSVTGERSPGKMQLN